MNSSKDSLSLSCKPPRETESIVKLSLGLGQRLTSFISDDVGNVVSVLTDQGIPFQEPLCSGAWVDFPVGLECLMGCFDSGIYIFGTVVWSRGPDFTASGI